MNFNGYDLKHKKLENIMGYCFAIGVVVSNLSIAIGNIFFVTSMLIGVCLIVQKRLKNNYVINDRENIFCKEHLYAIVLIVSMLPSMVFSPEVIVSTKGFLDMWFYRMAPFWLITLLIKEKDYAVNILIIFISGCCFETLLAIAQVVLGLESRGRGFCESPMQLAAYIAVVLPIVIVMVLDKFVDARLRKLGWFTLPVFMVGAIIGYSRGLWITLLVVVPILVYRYMLNNKKVLMWVSIISVSVICLFLSTPHLRNRFISSVNLTTNVSNVDRLWLWKSSLNMIEDYPLTGIGIKRFSKEYKENYILPNIKQKQLDQPHNNFLQIASEAGIIGLLGFISFSLFIIWSNFVDWYRNKNPYALMILGMFLAFSLFGMIGNPISRSSFMKAFWYLLGTLLVLRKS